MKSEIIYMLGIVAAGFAVNYALRALPFLLFAGKDREIPKWITRFGDLVSPVIIGALIFYSYSGLQWRTAWPYLAGALVVGLQLWRRNALVSIVAGTVLYMCLLNAGCMSSGISEIELDADNPSIRYSTQGFLIGEKFVNPNKIPGLLEDFEIPKSRTIHILVDEDAERDLAKARAFMKLLAHNGYRRSVLVTKQRSVGDSNFLEISIRSGAVWAGTERITPEMVPVRLKERGVPQSSVITVFLEDPGARMVAEAVERRLRGAGYRLVDVVEKRYSDMRVFRMSRRGLFYGAYEIDPADALAMLKSDRAGKSDTIMVYVDPDCNDESKLAVVKDVLARLAQGGYTNVENDWTPAAKAKALPAHRHPAAAGGATTRQTPNGPRQIRYKGANE